MKVIIVRHGETVENTQDHLCGWLPGNLSIKGFKQVQLLAKKLKDEVIDRIYSSDLKRAVQTTNEISRSHKTEVVFTHLLREISSGIFDGKHKSYYIEGLGKKDYYSFKPVGGENIQEVENRANEFIRIYLSDTNERTILISAHSIINIVLIKIFTKDDQILKNLVQSNACINILEFDSNKSLTNISSNDTNHLAVLEG